MVWLAAASLHEKGHEAFSTGELETEVKRLFGQVGPTVSTHINAHANASAPKNSLTVYNYLVRVGRGTHRLCRVTDPVHPTRVGHPRWPEQGMVDPEFWPLWAKWVAWQREADPVRAEVTAASDANAAARLADYIRGLSDFTLERSPASGYDHMGAIITEAILQAGINYRNVVLPRVHRLRRDYPLARTTSAFADLLRTVGAAELLQFSGEKLDRVEALTRFFLKERVETEADLRAWLADESNLARLREVPGVGPKTVDYLQILAGLDTSAIDRHLSGFLEEAGIAARTYEERKAVIGAAAAELGVDRAALDYGIWKYMADRAARGKLRAADLGGADDEQDDDPEAAHYLLSSYREAMLEHLLIGELMRTAWLESWKNPLEINKPQVDAAGVDVVLVRGGVVRPVQLKTSKMGARTSAVNVHTSLWDRPGSCVIWTWFDSKTLELKEFWWLGSPGQPLPPMDELERARHTKGDATGYKAPRRNLWVVPKRYFKRLTSVEELLGELFGCHGQVPGEV